MKNKVFHFLLILFFAAFSMLSFSCKKKDLPPKDKIIIGQAVSMSGPLAVQDSVVSGPYYDLWIKDVNAKGGIYVEEYDKNLPLELIKYDDKSDLGTMTKLLEKLIMEDKVDFLLPPVSTAFLYAAANIANKHKYIMIGGAGGAMKLKEVNLPYFFQSLNIAETQVPVLADVIAEVGAKKVAIISIEDLHGIEYNEFAEKEFPQKGLEIVMSKSYPMDVKDLSSLLKQAKSLNADALVGFSYPDDCMLATGQAMEIGYNPKVFFLSVAPAFSFYKGAFKDAIEGIMGGGAWNEKSSAGAKKFAGHFREVTGNEIGNYWGSIYFYAAMEHFTQAVEKAGTLNQEKIRKVMEDEKFDTVLGEFWYDDNHMSANHPGEIGQWQNGVFEVVDPGDNRTAKPIEKPKWKK